VTGHASIHSRSWRSAYERPRRLLSSGTRSELAQQHGLTDASKARDDHGLLCPPPLDPREKQIERLQLVISSHDGLRLSVGIGRIWIRDGSHRSSYMVYLATFIWFL